MYSKKRAVGFAEATLVFDPQAYARLAAGAGNAMSASNVTAKSYATNHYEYNTGHGVAENIVQGAGCSCSGGGGAYKYEYSSPRTYGDQAGIQYNRWMVRVTEILPDATASTDDDNPRRINYLNEVGNVLLSVYQLGSESAGTGYTGQRWGTFYKYDADGRVILKAHPSAISFPTSLSTLEAHDLILDNQDSDSNSNLYYLKDRAGLIETYAYGSTTTATSETVGGDVAGYLKEVSIKRGESGTAVKQLSQNYVRRTATINGTSVYVYPVKSTTVYRNDNGTGGQTTSYAYEWHSGGVATSKVTVTLPTVTTAQNGPSTAATEETVFDGYGYATWFKDARGSITRFAYDLGTGAVEQVIEDVDTARTSDEPAGWSTASGFGLHLTTNFDVDGLGRTVRVMDPNGNLTHVVYKDAAHEVRTYRGWTSSNTTTGPIEVVREYRPLPGAATGERTLYYEVLTSSAAPGVSSNRPDGSEALSQGNIQSLLRRLTNEAGQVVEADDYFSIPTYATATAQLGSSSNDSSSGNYHKTEFRYGPRGLLISKVSPTGTVSHSFFDDLDRFVGEWVGTDDVPTSDLTGDAVYDYRDFRYGVMIYGTAPAGTNMVKVSERQYDNGWVGEGNLTRATEYPGGTADPRVTLMAYDWRGRLVAIKGGSQGQEEAGTQRPLLYYTLDNLGQVTAVEQYDADAAWVGDWSTGALDVDFDGDGKVTADLSGGADAGRAIALQSDGRIVVAGSADNDFAVLRYNPDGSLDTSFDYDGKLTTNFGANDHAFAVAVQADGKIVVAGTSGSDVAVARYTSSGSLDSTFTGPDGTASGSFTINLGGSEAAYALAIDGSGRIVIAGKSGSDFGVFRLTSTGAFDTEFDTDGKQTINFSGGDDARALAIQADGKIIVAGTNGQDFAVARLTDAGALDTSFDGDGKLTTDIASGTTDRAYALAIGLDGKIVAAGSADHGYYADVALVRYNPNGSLDTSFDSDGKVTTNFYTCCCTIYAHAYAVTIQGDGKVVAGGDNGNGDFLIARYTAAGALDSSFDSDGIAAVNIDGQCGCGTTDSAYALTLQPDGKVVATGVTGTNLLAAARYGGGDGVPDKPSSSLLRAKTAFDYDELGQLYRSTVYSVNQSTGAVGSGLATNSWHDKAGNLLKLSVPGGLVTKYVYDGAGRNTKVFLSDGGGDPAAGAASNWDHADDVDGDKVLEQTELAYDAGGNVRQVTTRQRFHDETGTGELGTHDAGTKARVGHAAYFYDAADRTVVAVELGSVAGKATSATASTLVDTNRADATGSFVGDYLLITSGTGAGQQRRVKAYDGSTDTFTVDGDWATTPDSTSAYRVTPGVLASGKATSGFDSEHPDWLIDTTRTEPTGHFVGYYLQIVSGAGAGQVRRVTAYDGSTGKFTVDSNWTTFDTTSGYQLLPGSFVAGKATSATSTTLVDTARGETATDHFKHYTLVIVSGTGAGQRRSVSGYDGSTKTLTVASAWAVTPDSTSRYVLVGGDGLISNNTYDDAGNVLEVRGPLGRVTRREYDALGRGTRLIENYVDGTPSGDTDRITETTYNGNSDVLTLKAVLPDGPDAGSALDFQKTSYLYGVNSGTGVGGGNDLDSNDLLYAIAYPNTADGDSGSGSGAAYTHKFKYNALGQVKQTTDQNGTVHDYAFDVLGRLVSDAATTLGTFTRDTQTVNITSPVRRLEYGYDTAGRAETFTSYDAASGGSVVNQVLRQYNGLGQVTAEYQEHGGAVVTGGGSPSLKVQYTYSEMSGGANHSRLTKVTYPNGRVLRYEYSAGLDSTISRVSFLADDNSGAVGTHLEEYSYLGLGTIVERNRPQPGTKLTLVKQGAEPVGEAGDQYAGLDRFGRVLDQRWYKASTSSDLDRYGYGYDANSNRLYKENKVSTSRSELYAYDGLDRLVSLDRGTLSASKDSISGDTSFTADWTLDPLGNWDEYVVDPDGSGGGTSPATQDRTHDFQNRLTGGAGANTPEYDAAGSMVEDEAGNEYDYDAWGRLVAYDAGGNGGTADVAYSYDALFRRIVEDPATGDTTDLYYSLGRQVLEERLAGAAELQNVWGLGYVNQLVLRDRDSVAGGGLEERLYVQQDANYNVTSLTDTSGNVVERYVYDAYGKRTILNGDWTADGGEDDYANSSGYQGGRHDFVTGDVHFDLRDLDVELGRWKSADPIGYPDGMNRYEFVGSRPISHRDPSGLRDPDKQYADALKAGRPDIAGSVLAFDGGGYEGNAQAAAMADYRAMQMEEDERMRQERRALDQRSQATQQAVLAAGYNAGDPGLALSLAQGLLNVANALTSLAEQAQRELVYGPILSATSLPFWSLGDWSRGRAMHETGSGHQWSVGMAKCGIILITTGRGLRRSPAAPLAAAGRPRGAVDPMIKDAVEQMECQTLYHKGALLPGGKIDPMRALSTGTDSASVSALAREGTVHTFRVPRSVLNRWESEGYVRRIHDLDLKTGVHNEEIRILPPRSAEMEQYRVP